MTGPIEALRRLLAGLRKRSLERETEAELRLHLDLEIESAMRKGLTREQAERHARLQAGTIAAALDEVRDQRGLGWLDGTVLDLHHAWVGLRRQPGFALVTLAALAFAVGVNTLIFSIVDGVLLRPLPYPEPEHLVRVFEWTPRNPKFPLSIFNYLENRRAQNTLESIALYTREDVELTHDDRAEHLTAVRITDDFLPTLRIQPLIGRNFQPSEMVRSARVVILSHRLWSGRFGSDPAIVGKTLRLNREIWTIVGVLPAGFQHVGGSFRSPLQGDTVEVWAPLGLDLRPNGLRNWHFTNAIARLRPDVSPLAAQEDLNRIMDDLAARFPESYSQARARVEPLSAEVVGASRQTIDLLMAAGLLILCIACVNIAGLCVARVLARRFELAIRHALGGSPWRLVRAVLAENLLLGTAGGIAGLGLAATLLPLLRLVIPADFPRLHEIGLSPAGAVFAIVVALAASLGGGLIPALRHSSIAPRHGLNEDQRTSSTAREAQRLRGGLVVCEVALACVLCFGTILLYRSSVLLGARYHGFEPRGVLVFQLTLPNNAYRQPEQVTGLYDELLRRWREVPNIRAAGLGSNVPWSGYDENTGFDIVGRPPRKGEVLQARFQAASPGFFEALRFRLVQGRMFEERDTAKAMPVVVVNETLVRRYFPDGVAVGQLLDIWGAKRQIVGVVSDVRDRPADLEAEPAFWWPLAQQTFGRFQVVLRTDGEPLALVAPAGEVLRTLDRELPMAEITTMDQVSAHAMDERRFMFWLFQVFAALAMALSAVGIYGLLTYMVRQRRKELGIRMALGATRGGVLWTVVRDGMLFAAIGIGIGLALAPAAGQVLSKVLYGVEATDAPTLLAASLFMLVVSLLGSGVPAWAASRVEPISALRDS